MILATSITQPFLLRSQPFFESTVKHFDGKRICFCIGFNCEIKGWETVEVPINSLSITWQPANRKDYYCLQHGEFTKFYKFDPTEVIAFCDSDMVLQRDWDLKLNVEPSSFYVTNSSFPPTTLRDVISNIGCTNPAEVVNKYMIGIDEREFCTCILIANADAWRMLYNRVKINKGFLNYFNHHATWQLLIKSCCY